MKKFIHIIQIIFLSNLFFRMIVLLFLFFLVLLGVYIYLWLVYNGLYAEKMELLQINRGLRVENLDLKDQDAKLFEQALKAKRAYGWAVAGK